MEKQVFIERKTLSDNSHVHNVVLSGPGQVRLICASQLDAETIESFLHEQINKHHLIGIE